MNDQQEELIRRLIPILQERLRAGIGPEERTVTTDLSADVMTQNMSVNRGVFKQLPIPYQLVYLMLQRKEMVGWDAFVQETLLVMPDLWFPDETKKPYMSLDLMPEENYLEAYKRYINKQLNDEIDLETNVQLARAMKMIKK